MVNATTAMTGIDVVILEKIEFSINQPAGNKSRAIGMALLLF